MNELLIMAVMVAAALAAYAAVFCVAVRFIEERHAPFALLLAVVLVYPPFAWAAASSTASFWHFSSIFFCGVAVFVFGFGAVSKSLSLRMFDWIRAAPRLEASLESITTAVMLVAYKERVAILQRKGLIEEDGLDYRLTDKGRGVLTRVARIKKVLRVESGGLYTNE